MLESTQVITSLFLDCWKRLILKGVLIKLFIHGTELLESPLPQRKRSSKHGLYADASRLTQGSWWLPPFLLQTNVFPDVPSNQKGDSSEKITLHQSSAVHPCAFWRSAGADAEKALHWWQNKLNC
ncbi:hypothetical protein GOODEAATRI_012984 [Goodea atripinnis]|uniref:Uncharacterized protein n=1 Tax=Goodea atripinnis TaxID=208336 RepID=A0ABV0PDP4_9TELE